MDIKTKFIIEMIITFITCSVIFFVALTNNFSWNNILLVIFLVFTSIYWNYVNYDDIYDDDEY